MIATGRIVRLAERDRARLHFFLDGQVCTALAGDTVLTAMLASGHALRKSEFGPEQRAGFCLMGACQDCWVWQDEGPRLRACSALVSEGMRLRTTPSESWP
jgi:hypothetical protein